MLSSNDFIIIKYNFKCRTNVIAKYNEKSNTYAPICDNYWKEGLCLKIDDKKSECKDCVNKAYVPFTDELLINHIEGKHILGFYPLLPDDTCHLIAADFDNHDGNKNPLEDVISFAEECYKEELYSYVFRSKSGKGYHVYLFFETAVPAWKARTVVNALIDKAGNESVRGRLTSFDCLFPKQDRLKDKNSLGNLIALPFQGKAMKSKHTLILEPDSNYLQPYENQTEILKNICRISQQRLDEIIEEKGLQRKVERFSNHQRNVKTDKVYSFPLAQIDFIIEKCAWIRHCKDDAAIILEPEWFAALSILGRCQNGERLSHEWSSSHSGYSRDKTNEKLENAMKAAPRTCENIRNELNGEQYCSKCPAYGHIKSPITLGMINNFRAIPSSNDYNNTDLGNAESLVRLHGKDLKYCFLWNYWLIWNSIKWEKDATNEVERKAKQTIKDISLDIQTSAGLKESFKYRQNSESANRIGNMIKLAKSEDDIPVLPDMLDANIWLINCLNGTLDLRTGNLNLHRREDLITKTIPVNYDPNASCPTFLEFLDKIMNGNRNLIEFLKRAIGYSLTGDISEQCIFFLYETGANGKSTFLEIIRKMLGDYSKQTDFNTFLQQKNASVRNDLARLAGSRFVTAVEVEAEKRLSEVLVKQITGGDPITARFLYGEFFEYYPTFKVFWAANHKPGIWGSDHGIWRRIHLIPFRVTISDKERDPNIGIKLLKELPGILTWAVKGCLEWQKNGLNPPNEVKMATEEYRIEQDILADFISERCNTKKNAKVTKKDLYEAYLKWAEQNGEKPLGKKTFGAKIKEKGFNEDKIGTWYWMDIELKADTQIINNDINISLYN